MPLQSSGIIVVDKTSVITTAPGSVSVQGTGTVRSNGIFGNIIGGNTNSGINANNYETSGVIHKHAIQEWQSAENEFSSVHSTKVRKNSRSLPSNAVVAASSLINHHQNSTKTATVTTIPLASTAQFNTNQMNQISQQQQHQQHIHHQSAHQPQQQQGSSRQQQLQQQTATVLQTAAQSGQQVIVSEEFLEHATFTSNGNAANSANVINLTANDLVNSTQIIKLVSDGNGGNVLIDSLGNVTNGSHLHGNPKLLVGNLAVLSKQSGSSTGQQTFNFLNAKGGISYLTTTKSQASTSQQGQSQQQIHHIASVGANLPNGNGSSIASATSTMVQKMGVPRNVQVVTRVQTITPSSPQPHQQVQQHQTSLQHNLHNNQVIMQQKYVPGIVNTSTSNFNTKMNTSTLSGALKKQVANSNKFGQQKQAMLNQNAKCNSIQAQSQQQSHVIHAQAASHHPQQQQQQQQHLQTVGIAHASHATIKPVRSHKVVRKIVGSTGKNSAATANTSTKYVMQSPLVLSNATNSHMVNSKIQNSSANSGNIIVPQQMIGTINNSGCAAPGGGAIKFVNAHGAVLQSHHGQPSIQNTVQQQQLHTSHQNQKVSRSQISRAQQQANQNQQLQQQQFNQATAAVVTNEGILIPAYVNNSQSPSNGEEIMINGTQMTEEMSARILQSLSQKSVYNNMRQYQHQIPQQQQAQQKVVQQHQPSSLTPNMVFESSGAILQQREYTLCKSSVGGHQQQSSQIMPQQKIISTSNIVYEPSNRDFGICKTTTINQHVQQQQQHPQKMIHQQLSSAHSSLSASTPNILFDSAPAPRIYSQQHGPSHPPHRTQSQSIQHQQSSVAAPNAQHALPHRRTQSLDRKHGGSSQINRRSTDFFKVNTTEIQSSYPSSTTYFDNIPLPSPIQRGDNAPAAQQAEHDDDIIGEEVRPIPVSTHDVRLQALHALLQDHTYAKSIGLSIEMLQQQQQQQQQQSLQHQSTQHAVITSHAHHHQQQQQHHIGEVQSQTHPQSQQQQQLQHMYVGGVAPATSSALTAVSMSGVHTGSGGLIQPNLGNMSSATLQLTTSNSLFTSSNLGNYNYSQTAHHNQRDDDANSVISNESRHGNDGPDNDLGEETETAPEAEAEDDSVTRCICDLTHDDGYMICCDKCSAWQHVDCMGIDRQNIPEEYLCEICQPRPVDRARAKSLQLLKRKEQTQLLLNAQTNAASGTGPMLTDSNGQYLPVGNMGQERPQQLIPGTTGNTTNNSATSKKNKLIGTKKKELLKRVKKDRSSSKRRETKRTTKRKTKSTPSNEANSPDEFASASTNHYSPELRARLIAIGKQMPSFAEQRITHGAGTEDKCTTVPHAGGKILISNLDIQPNSPIIELRGKYMLATQYKNQNPSINMNLHPPNGLQKNQKIPGAFIFFHKLSQEANLPEICVDTRTYGNEARYVRRSCRPNAEIQHSLEKGIIHLWLVSLANIKASTEITVRHEPHDLAALENKQFNFPIMPTSTMCACGLTKDCPFATPTQQTTPASGKSTQKKVVINGSCLDGKSTSQATQNASQNHTSGNKKPMQNNASRGRSTSSSGESNAGLLSPNSSLAQTYSIATASMMHDSGVYTSSSSPSVSIPSPTQPQTINSPPQMSSSACQKIVALPPIEQQNDSTTVTTSSSITPTSVKSPQKCNTQPRKTPVKHVRNSSISEDSPNQNVPTPNTSQSTTPQEEKRESRKLTREERKMEAIVRAIEKMEKNQQRKQELKQARNSSGGGSAKRRNSSSPSPKRLKSQTSNEGGDNSADSSLNIQSGQQVSQSVRKSSSGSLPRKKKRKSSKSYQIHSNQRKRRRSRVNSNDSDGLTSEESSSLLSPPLARTISLPACLPSPEEIAERQKCLVASLSLDCAQSQGLSSGQQQLQAPRREEIPLPPLQPLQPVPSLQSLPPPLQPIQQHIYHSQPLHHPSSNEPHNVNSSNAAGLLLAFATTTDPDQSPVSAEKSQEADMCKSPVRLPHHIVEPGTPQTPPRVSSTCMLVEAAVGPLEGLEMLGGNSSEFKLPTKTKTKKTIMNDWLNQSSECQDYQQHPTHYGSPVEEHQHQITESYHRASPSLQDVLKQQQMLLHCDEQESPPGRKGIDTLVQAAESISEYTPVQSSPVQFLSNSSQEEPHNLSIVAKVEEFIHQNDANFICTEEIKCEPTVIEPPTSLMLPINAMNNCSGSSSVKKRWLRQAISEECSDEVSPSASSPTQVCPNPNGFMTPLKKRRVIRECNDTELISNSPEDLSMAKVSRDDFLSVSKMEIDGEESVVDSKIKIKQELSEVDDEVDVLNSPPPDEKMITPDDNLIKIEPEDVSAEIKVDVEKEENSSSSEMVKKAETSESASCVNSVDDVKAESSGSTVEVKEDIKIAKFESTETVLEGHDVKPEIELVKAEELSILACNEEVVIEESIPPCSVPAKSEAAEKESSESVTDEIADIQKRLHSFHTENIMILQSRNKSKIARSLKLDPEVKAEKKVVNAVQASDVTPVAGSPQTIAAKNKRKSEKAKASTVVANEKRKKDNKKDDKHKSSKKKKTAENVKKVDEPKNKSVKKKAIEKKNAEVSRGVEGVKRLSSDENKGITENEVKTRGEFKDKSEPPPLVPTTLPHKEEMEIDEKHLQAALTIPNFNRTLSTTPIANYVLNSVEQSYDITTLLAAPPPPPPPLPASEAGIGFMPTITTNTVQSASSQPPPLHLPYYYNTIYGKPVSSMPTLSGSLSSLSPSTNLLLSEYMDSSKSKSFSSLGGYISHFGLGLSKSASTTITAPISSLSSTSLATTTPSESKSSLSSKISSASTSSGILTKTACHDPRLNPSLTVPEPPPAPRRKLSINEYRKRKQLSSDCGSANGSEKVSNANCNSQGSTSSGNSSLENGDKYDSASNSNDATYSEKITDVSKVQFSPAPTLLEQQQEIICERLRSLKKSALCGSASSLVSLSSSSMLLSSATSTSIGDAMTTSLTNNRSSCNSTPDVNCFSLSGADDRNDEFAAARRRTLRNNSTSSLESISSSTSSRTSSCRGTTPVPQQYDGMDSPCLVTTDDDLHPANIIENIEVTTEIETTTTPTTADDNRHPIIVDVVTTASLEAAHSTASLSTLSATSSMADELATVTSSNMSESGEEGK